MIREETATDPLTLLFSIDMKEPYRHCRMLKLEIVGFVRGKRWEIYRIYNAHQMYAVHLNY